MVEKPQKKTTTRQRWKTIKNKAPSSPPVSHCKCLMMLNDKFVAEQSSPFLTRFSARWFPSSIPFLSFFPFDLPFIAETATIARFFINRYSFCFVWASATLLSALERKCSAQLSSALTVSHSTAQYNAIVNNGQGNLLIHFGVGSLCSCFACLVPTPPSPYVLVLEKRRRSSEVRSFSSFYFLIAVGGSIPVISESFSSLWLLSSLLVLVLVLVLFPLFYFILFYVCRSNGPGRCSEQEGKEVQPPPRNMAIISFIFKTKLRPSERGRRSRIPSDSDSSFFLFGREKMLKNAKRIPAI